MKQFNIWIGFYFKDAYIITGTMGTKEYMNENNPSKRIVRLPEYYYKAFW